MNPAPGQPHVPSLRILMIEDDPDFSEIVQAGLEQAGMKPTATASVPDGLLLLQTAPFDLLLLDMEIAGEDGMDVLRTLRADNNPLPVIIMTGKRVDTRNTVEGLETGADDYLRKPFAIDELLARIHAVYRRHQTSLQAACIAGDLTIDRLQRTATCNGESIDLTLRELELLALFARQPDRDLSRSEILDAIWSDSAQSTGLDNTLDVHISRLRKKLAEHQSRCTIRTLWGKGFTLAIDDA